MNSTQNALVAHSPLPWATKEEAIHGMQQIVNDSMEIQSLLYDLNLLPEQVEPGTGKNPGLEYKMATTILHCDKWLKERDAAVNSRPALLARVARLEAALGGAAHDAETAARSMPGGAMHTKSLRRAAFDSLNEIAQRARAALADKA